VPEPFVCKKAVSHSEYSSRTTFSASIQLQKIQVCILLFFQLFQELNDIVHLVDSQGPLLDAMAFPFDGTPLTCLAGTKRKSEGARKLVVDILIRAKDASDLVVGSIKIDGSLEKGVPVASCCFYLCYLGCARGEIKNAYLTGIQLLGFLLEPCEQSHHLGGGAPKVDISQQKGISHLDEFLDCRAIITDQQAMRVYCHGLQQIQDIHACLRKIYMGETATVDTLADMCHGIIICELSEENGRNDGDAHLVLVDFIKGCLFDAYGPMRADPEALAAIDTKIGKHMGMPILDADGLCWALFHAVGASFADSLVDFQAVM